jgi:cellulose synthase/poly-beta-1,6-N-acetylglucosamine synthase-like glycosyltransferase
MNAGCRVPQVSVVMAVYNGEKYLRQAVESILHQTFTDFEFIIVDDGSTDTTPAILDAYHDPRIVRLRNVRNLGPSRSRSTVGWKSVVPRILLRARMPTISPIRRVWNRRWPFWRRIRRWDCWARPTM